MKILLINRLQIFMHSLYNGKHAKYALRYNKINFKLHLFLIHKNFIFRE